MDIIYKTFAEILLLHEFYLTESEGNTIFDIAQQSDKINYLVDNYNDNDPHINDDLIFEPTTSSATLLRNLHLKLLPTYSGFKIVMDVQEKILQDGTTVYAPTIDLPVDMSIDILLIKNGNYLDRFSNARILRSIPTVYYFSNDDVPGTKTVPSLSNPVSAFDPAFSYEMGELSFKDGAVKQFINDGSADPWATVTDNGYVNENDRLLVPFQFDYSFDQPYTVTQASFTLKDQAGSVFKTIQLSATEPIQKAALDFSKINSDLSITFPTSISDVSVPAFYTLEVSGNNGYSKKYQLLFFDDATKLKSCWGIVNIKPLVQSTGFNLLDNEGDLFTRITSTGTRIEAPVFEVRVKSRLAYWWYRSNNNSSNLTISATTQDFLSNASGVLKTNKPRTTTYGPTLFTTDGSNFQNLPNPGSEALLKEDAGLFYKDVFVGQSDMFPVVAV
jgi:hypothetical protein